MLAYIATAKSFWYNINGNSTSGKSLCKRLGFVDDCEHHAFLVAAGLTRYVGKKDSNTGKVWNVLQIRGTEWKKFIEDPDNELDTKHAICRQAEFDMGALLEGTIQDDKKRYKHHLIQLSDRTDKSRPDKFTHQKMPRNNKLDTNPSTLISLRSKQREFRRNIRQMVADTLLNSEDLYK